MTLRDAVSDLLRAAGNAHHRAFLDTDGDDPDWPTWYASFLARPLGLLLGQPIERDTLARELAVLDVTHRATVNAPDWPRFYADWFLGRYVSGYSQRQTEPDAARGADRT